jgi:hypothetical protein
MEFIREAGFGIFFVMAFGGASLAVALRHAVAPRRDRLALVVGFAVLTLLAGLMGTVTGVQVSASAYGAAHTPPGTLFLVGLSESLNNLVAAIVVVSLDAMMATLGAYRQARAELEPRALATASG